MNVVLSESPEEKEIKLMRWALRSSKWLPHDTLRNMTDNEIQEQYLLYWNQDDGGGDIR